MPTRSWPDKQNRSTLTAPQGHDQHGLDHPMADVAADGAGQAMIHLLRPWQEHEPAAASSSSNAPAARAAYRIKATGVDLRPGNVANASAWASCSRRPAKTTNTSAPTRIARNWTCSRLLATTSAPIGAPNEITAATTIAKGRRRGWRVLDGRHAPPICMRTRPPSREYTNGRQSGTLWGTRCSGGKSTGLEHLRAPYHRPSMWKGLYPLPIIRDGNTFDKITTLLTGAETVQGRLA